MQMLWGFPSVTVLPAAEELSGGAFSWPPQLPPGFLKKESTGVAFKFSLKVLGPKVGHHPHRKGPRGEEPVQRHSAFLTQRSFPPLYMLGVLRKVSFRGK